MIKQNNEKLLKCIQDYGCFFLSCVNLVEWKTDIKLNENEINDLWHKCKKLGYINNNDDIVNSASIMNVILKLKNSDLVCLEIGTYKPKEHIEKSEIQYYKGVPEHLKKLDKYYIQKLKTYGKYGTHFRVITENGHIFDSVDGYYEYDKIMYNIVYVFTNKRK